MNLFDNLKYNKKIIKQLEKHINYTDKNVFDFIYKKSNKPLLNSKLIDTEKFLKSINFNPNINYENNITILSKIYDDYQLITEKLNELHPNLIFDINISGGSIVNIINNLQNSELININDIDYFINIDYQNSIRLRNDNKEDYSYRNDQLICHNKDNPNHIDNITNNIISYFNKSNKNLFDYIYYPKIDTDFSLHYDGYISPNIEGVLKINNSSLNFKSDIVFISNDITSYIDKFDFNICKNILSIINFNNNLSKEDKANLIFSSIILWPSAINDYIKKQLTIDTGKFTYEAINYFINKRAKKMFDKFPDFNIVIADFDEILFKHEIEKLTDLINTYYEMHLIDKNLNNNNNNNVRKLNKI